jgi:hypothetical protein
MTAAYQNTQSAYNNVEYRADILSYIKLSLEILAARKAQGQIMEDIASAWSLAQGLRPYVIRFAHPTEPQSSTGDRNWSVATRRPPTSSHQKVRLYRLAAPAQVRLGAPASWPDRRGTVGSSPVAMAVQGCGRTSRLSALKCLVKKGRCLRQERSGLKDLRRSFAIVRPLPRHPGYTFV